MLESIILMVVAGGLAWLYFRYQALKDQVSSLEAAIAGAQTANAADIEVEVGKLVEELKQMADHACAQVAGKIGELKALQEGAGLLPNDPLPPRRGPKSTTAGRGSQRSGLRTTENRQGAVPVDTIVRLAEQGVSPVDIARQVKVGLAEVELTLKVRHNRQVAAPQASTDTGYLGKEVGIA